MCELPARSIPGSEMLCVENTRIRGTNVAAGGGASIVAVAFIGRQLRSAGRLLAADHEDAVVAVGGDGAEELVADLGRPGADVGLGDRIGRPDLDDGADGHRAHPLLRFEERAGAGGPAGVDDLGGGDGSSSVSVAVMGSVSFVDVAGSVEPFR